MRRIFVPFIICAILILCCISCKDSNGKTVDYDSEWFDNTTPEFDTKRQSIIYREHMRYDIKGNIAVPYTITNSISYNFCCEFSFFNYGEDIRLFNGCNEDFFITGIGTIRYARVLKREDNGNTVVTNSDDGKKSVLNYKVLDRNYDKNETLVEIELETGRHHQIRVQFASRNHPLCGDQRYGKMDKTQIALCAYHLEFVHPVTKENMSFSIEKPSLQYWTDFDL